MNGIMGAVARSPRWLQAVVVMAAVCGLATAATAKTTKKAKGKDSTKIQERTTIRVETDGGYLGVYMQELTNDVLKGLDVDKSTKGVLISGVEDDSPADKAGIEEGDIIVSFNGKTMASPDALRDAVRDVKPGEEASIEVLHEGESKTIQVTVGEREHGDSFAYAMPGEGMEMHGVPRAFTFIGGPRLGVQAHEIENDALGSYFGVKSGEGVLVLDVEENSVAGKAGVQAGDVIRKIGDETIGDIGALRESLRDFNEGDEFTISVLRKGKSQELKATMDDQDNTFSFRGPRDMPRWFGVSPEGRAHMRALERHGRDDIEKQLQDLREQLEDLKQQLDRKDG